MTLSKRFLETTRGQVFRLIRRGDRTVEELAAALGLTDNAIRAHLATLERDGLVRQEGVRRGPGAGKPATVYQLAAGIETDLSRAYAPVLTELLEELGEQLPADRRDALLAGVGRRIAGGVPMRARGREARVREAVTLLNELGGDATLESENGDYRIRGCGCPLSAAVSRRTETCRVVQALLSELIGTPVTQRCMYDPKPRCYFVVPPSA